MAFNTPPRWLSVFELPQRSFPELPGWTTAVRFNAVSDIVVVGIYVLLLTLDITPLINLSCAGQGLGCTD